MLEDRTVANTIISRWGTKPKFISMVLLSFSFASVKSLILLPAVLLITGTLLVLSRVPIQLLLRRLKVPALFIFIMAFILLFFTPGQAIGELGPLTVTRDGLESALLMVGRLAAILTLMVILFSTSTIQDVLAVMQSLGIPELMIDMLMFTHRYLHETAAMFRQMKTAMVLRGFEGNRLQALYTYSYLAGTILVRSYEQSQRVYQAMIMRGYGQFPIERPFRKAQRQDHVLCAMCVILSLALGLAQLGLLLPGV